MSSIHQINFYPANSSHFHQSELITRANSPELETDYNAVNTVNDSIAHSNELLERLSYLSVSEVHEDVAPSKKARITSQER